jgi:hypothetical protein
MSGHVVSDIQTRAEGESLYIRYNTDANVVNDLKNDSSYELFYVLTALLNDVQTARVRTGLETHARHSPS